MSTNLATSHISAPEYSPAADTHPDRNFHVVAATGKRARPRVVYALVTVVGLFAIVVSQLLLSVGVSEGAYEISGLEATQKTLSRTSQSLSVQLDSVASPQNLAVNAEALGMVRNTNPSAFLRLSDGKVLGVPAAATSTPDSAIGAGDLVPNVLLKGVTAATATGVTPGTVGTAGNRQSAPDSSGARVVVPLQGGLPSPTTR